MHALEDRIVVVTGASSGIGRATAVEFARRGATVAMFARRRRSLDDVAAQCRELGVETLVMDGDVRFASDLTELADRTAGRFGRIDVWVNNAAVHLFGAIEDVPVESWHRVIETNLLGTYHGIRAVVPLMREQGRGVIVNVASLLAHVAAPTQSAYVASKFAIRGMADSVRQEVRDTGIKVCTVMPGPVDTPLFRHAANYTGRDVIPLTPVIDARRVAAAIVASATRPRRERIVGVPGRGVVAMSKCAPGATERLTAWAIERNHFADRPSDAWGGNLHAPLNERGQVSGGWTRWAKWSADPRTTASGSEPPQRRGSPASGADGSASLGGSPASGPSTGATS